MCTILDMHCTWYSHPLAASDFRATCLPYSSAAGTAYGGPGFHVSHSASSPRLPSSFDRAQLSVWHLRC